MTPSTPGRDSRALVGFGRFWACIEVRAVKAPDPEIFKLALERAGCALSEAVMIGDRLDNDIRPARLRGWKTIRVAQGFAAELALF